MGQVRVKAGVLWGEIFPLENFPPTWPKLTQTSSAYCSSTTEPQEVMVATLDRAWPGLSIVV